MALYLNLFFTLSEISDNNNKSKEDALKASSFSDLLEKGILVIGLVLF